MRLAELSATEALLAVRERRVKVEELISACADQVDLLEPDVRAWTYFDREQALGQARRLDRRPEPLGDLAGLPVGVKDVYNTQDMPTQMGSPIWEGFRPGNDARVVHYLRKHDSVVMGKTVTAEFAVHAPGPTRNPHDLRRSPGTSSSGSAAAVAARMVPLALGTQTAGSVIRPASYCGVYGYKPSFGLLPRTGVLKTTDTLDTLGLFARTPADLRLLFDAVRVRGRDFPISDPTLSLRADPPLDRPWRIAVVRGPTWGDAEGYARDDLLTFARRLSAEGYAVEEVRLPAELEAARAVHDLIYDRTLAYYFRREFRQHTLVSPIMYEIVRRGNAITLEGYRGALERQRRIAASLDRVFEWFDVVLCLSTGGEAPVGLDSVDRPDSCLTWTLCWVPAVSVPAFSGPDRLPYGAQLVGRRYADYRLLSFVAELEERGLIPAAPVPDIVSTPRESRSPRGRAPGTDLARERTGSSRRNSPPRASPSAPRS